MSEIYFSIARKIPTGAQITLQYHEASIPMIRPSFRAKSNKAPSKKMRKEADAPKACTFPPSSGSLA